MGNTDRRFVLKILGSGLGDMADGRKFRCFGMVAYPIECYILKQDLDTLNDAEA